MLESDQACRRSKMVHCGTDLLVRNPSRIEDKGREVQSVRPQNLRYGAKFEKTFRDVPHGRSVIENEGKDGRGTFVVRLIQGPEGDHVAEELEKNGGIGHGLVLEEEIDLDRDIVKPGGEHQVKMGLLVGEADFFRIKVIEAVVVESTGEGGGKKAPKKSAHMVDLPKPCFKKPVVNPWNFAHALPFLTVHE